MMKDGKRLTVFYLALLTAVFGCDAMPTRSHSNSVPITTFEQVAGTWQGLSKRMPGMSDDAQVMLIINEQGRFNFVSDRGTELLLGTGRLTILDGHMFGTTSSGTGTFTLHHQAGASVLLLEAALNNGRHYYIELIPMKQPAPSDTPAPS
jgi:hypothetical protein